MRLKLENGFCTINSINLFSAVFVEMILFYIYYYVYSLNFFQSINISLNILKAFSMKTNDNTDI